MRFTKSLRARLEAVFSKKMASLAFSDDRPVSTWTQYLEGVGCRRVHCRCYDRLPAPRPPRGFVMIKDPIWYGDHILIPRDLARRILILEYLP